MAAGGLKPPRTLSEIRRKREKRERREEKERKLQRQLDEAERKHQQYHRELRQISEERKELVRREIRAKEERDFVIGVVVGLIVLVTVIAVIVAIVMKRRRGRKKEMADAAGGALPGSSGIIPQAQVVVARDGNPFGMYGPAQPQVFGSPFQYQPQPMFATAPSSPMVDPGVDPSGFTSPTVSYSDAPPAYNPGPQ